MTNTLLLRLLLLVALTSACSSKRTFHDTPTTNGGSEAGGEGGASAGAAIGGGAGSAGTGALGDAAAGEAGCGSLSDPKNCGTCGFDCTALTNVKADSSEVECRDGSCFVPPAACLDGFGHCSSQPNDGCEANLTDPRNCGACTAPCTGETPLCSATDNGPVCAASCSAPTADLCLASCVNLNADPRNCGTCGHDCTALANVNAKATGVECRSGSCYVPASACNAGYGRCSSRPDDGCETNLKTETDCGACGVSCMAPTALCSGDATAASCSSNCVGPLPNLCGAKCVDFQSDPVNCGSCGHDCTGLKNVKTGGVGVECRSGSCYLPPTACVSGFAHCSAQADDGCEADLSAPAHCGSCSLGCSGSTPLCSMQSPAHCSPSCAGSAPTVCGTQCVNLSTDYRNCGSCGHDCSSLPSVKQGSVPPAVQCTAGACVLQPSACVSGTGHCSTNPNSGCETDLTQPMSCGSCSKVCSAPTALCSTSGGVTCASSCVAPNPDLCGSKCVNNKNDPTNCGTCGHDCTALAHLKSGATVSCNATGGCVVPTGTSACAATFANCTAASPDTDGCETPINTNTNCGGCGVTCTLPNASSSCQTGTCTLGSCNTGFGNCTSAPGCETALTTVSNCGACGAACPAGGGWKCAGTPAACATTCGDGIVAGNEQCDDGNKVANDGCSATCVREAGYTCTGSPSVCTNPCAPNPCLNQGTCSSAAGVAKCQCVSGFGGATCNAPLYTRLANLAGTTFCRALGVSGNGSVIVGRCSTSLVGDPIPVKWNAAGTPTKLPSPMAGAAALGVNLNGSAIVGYTTVDPSLGGSLAALWPAVIQPTLLGGVDFDSSSYSTRVSSNGLVVVGTSNNRAVYWKTTDQIVQPVVIDPGTFIFNDSYGVSADGSVIVGQSTFGQNVAAFRWASGVWGTLPNVSTASTSFARGVSDNGLVTVGFSGGQAVRWLGTAAPLLLGTAGNATAASSTGSIIVGVTGNTASGSSAAFLWDAANTARPLSDVLTELGVNLGASSLAEATDVSDNGSVIVGWGNSGSTEIAWMVNLAGTGVSGL